MLDGVHGPADVPGAAETLVGWDGRVEDHAAHTLGVMAHDFLGEQRAVGAAPEVPLAHPERHAQVGDIRRVGDGVVRAEIDAACREPVVARADHLVEAPLFHGVRVGGGEPGPRRVHELRAVKVRARRRRTPLGQHDHITGAAEVSGEHEVDDRKRCLAGPAGEVDNRVGGLLGRPAAHDRDRQVHLGALRPIPVLRHRKHPALDPRIVGHVRRTRCALIGGRVLGGVERGRHAGGRSGGGREHARRRDEHDRRHHRDGSRAQMVVHVQCFRGQHPRCEQDCHASPHHVSFAPRRAPALGHARERCVKPLAQQAGYEGVRGPSRVARYAFSA
jgi:hypothetical protein